MSQLQMPDNVKKFWPEFVAMAQQHGYEMIDQQAGEKKSHPIWYVKTRNNNKVELVYKQTQGLMYSIGRTTSGSKGLSKDDIETILVPELERRGVSVKKALDTMVRVHVSLDIVKGFFDFVQIIEDINKIAQQRIRERLGVGNDHSQTYLFIALVIELAVKMNQGWALNRDLLGFDKLDDLLTDGYSIEGRKQEQNGKNAYREHVNPSINVIAMGVNAVKNGVPATDIAGMLKKQNRILRISDGEAYKLDNTLGYRTTMPENWDGEDPYARITAAEIILEKFDK
jgi:hypothetical protein